MTMPSKLIEIVPHKPALFGTVNVEPPLAAVGMTLATDKDGRKFWRTLNRPYVFNENGRLVFGEPF